MPGYVRANAATTTIIPDGVDFATATVVTRHAPTAMHLLADHAKVQPGDWVLVMGAAGGLGSAGVQVAKHLGAEVIAAAGSDDRVVGGSRSRRRCRRELPRAGSHHRGDAHHRRQRRQRGVREHRRSGAVSQSLRRNRAPRPPGHGRRTWRRHRAARRQQALSPTRSP